MKSPTIAPDADIYSALTAQEAANVNSVRVSQQLRAEYDAYVAHEYVHRVEIPEHVQERGRFAEHANIADTFRPVARNNIVIGASNSRI